MTTKQPFFNYLNKKYIFPIFVARKCLGHEFSINLKYEEDHPTHLALLTIKVFPSCFVVSLRQIYAPDYTFETRESKQKL